MNRHQPAEHAERTITCATSGTTGGFTDDVGNRGDVPCPTLADLEAFCVVVRERGGQDDLVIPQAVGLSVTLDMA